MVTDRVGAEASQKLADLLKAAQADEERLPTGEPEPDDGTNPEDLDDEEPDDDAADEESEPEPEPDEEEKARLEQEERINRATRERLRRIRRQEYSDIVRAMDGDKKAEESLNAQARKILEANRRREALAKQAAVEELQRQDTERRERESYRTHDQYLHLYINDRPAFNRELAGKPSVQTWWQQFQTLKASLGLPDYATSDNVQLRLQIENQALQPQAQTQSQSERTVSSLEDLYVALQDESDSDKLTNSDWDRLMPENYEDLPVRQAMLKMSAEYGRLLARRTGRRPAQSQEEQQPRTRRPGPATMLPRSSGSPNGRTEEQILDQFLRDRQNGNRSPRVTEEARKVLEKYGAL